MDQGSDAGTSKENSTVESQRWKGWDRRHSFRVRVSGGASVWHKNKLCGYYAVGDLSIGGCSLLGESPRRVGEEVSLILRLPQGHSLAIKAVVCRVDGHAMGLRFEHATPQAEDCIQDLVVNAFAHRDAQAAGRAALVIEPRAEARRALVELFSELGQPAIGVATALDAVQLLLAQGDRIECAFIEAESAHLPSFELVEYLTQHHPSVRRVLIGEGQHLGAHWTAEAAGEVHALLETPCSRETAHRVLMRLQNLPRGTALS